MVDRRGSIASKDQDKDEENNNKDHRRHCAGSALAHHTAIRSCANWTYVIVASIFGDFTEIRPALADTTCATIRLDLKKYFEPLIVNRKVTIEGYLGSDFVFLTATIQTASYKLSKMASLFCAASPYVMALQMSLRSEPIQMVVRF